MFPRLPITEQKTHYKTHYIVKIKLVFVICYWSEKVPVISIGLSPESRVTLSTFVTMTDHRQKTKDKWKFIWMNIGQNTILK